MQKDVPPFSSWTGRILNPLSCPMPVEMFRGRGASEVRPIPIIYIDAVSVECTDPLPILRDLVTGVHPGDLHDESAVHPAVNLHIIHRDPSVLVMGYVRAMPQYSADLLAVPDVFRLITYDVQWCSPIPDETIGGRCGEPKNG